MPKKIVRDDYKIQGNVNYLDFEEMVHHICVCFWHWDARSRHSHAFHLASIFVDFVSSSGFQPKVFIVVLT
jgi:hypothetical protein